MTIVDDAERRALLAERHLLGRNGWYPVPTVTDVANALVAVHSTDPVSVYLSIAARLPGADIATVSSALYDERSVIRHHAMRRTLWVMSPEVTALAHAACTRKLAVRERTRTAKLAGDPAWLDQAIDEVIELVSQSDNGLNTRQIGEARPDLRREITFAQGTNHEAKLAAHTRAALVAAFDGSIVRTRPAGTWIGSQYAWIDAARWAEVDWDAHSEVEGMSGLLERWLDRFGPGTLDDMVWWTGSTKGLVRKGLASLNVEPVQLSAGDGVQLVGQATPDEPEPWVALLPALDATAMGWKHRSWYLDDETSVRVTDRFGNIGPTVWADGRIVGGWAQRLDGEIAIELTGAISRDHHEMLTIEVDRVRQFVGDARFKVRFPSPNQNDLLA